MRFHAIYWPAFLMAAGLDAAQAHLRPRLAAVRREQDEKSRGNIVRAEPIQQVMGADALRYFLLREVVFGQDGSFSYDALVGRYNSDLANGLGNLASRTLTMIHQYRKGVVPEARRSAASPRSLTETIAAAQAAFDRFEFSKGLEAIWALISAVDKFIVEQRSVEAGRSSPTSHRSSSGRHALHRRRSAAHRHRAGLPGAARIRRQDLGAARHDASRSKRCASTTLAWGGLQPGQKIGEVAGVFPRIEPKPAIDKMRELEDEATAAQAVLMGKKPEPPQPKAPPKSPSTISSRWICAWAWCLPPSASKAPTS